MSGFLQCRTPTANPSQTLGHVPTEPHIHSSREGLPIYAGESTPQHTLLPPQLRFEVLLALLLFHRQCFRAESCQDRRRYDPFIRHRRVSWQQHHAWSRAATEERMALGKITALTTL